MNTKSLFIVALTLFSYSSLLAQNKTFINYFTVAQGIAQPVTIKTNLGDFTFYNTYILHGRIESIEAYTINGNRIIINSPRVKEDQTPNGIPFVEQYYILSQYDRSSPYAVEGQDNQEHNPYYFSSEVAEVKGFMANNYKNWRRKIYAGTGWGTQYGGAWGVNMTAKALRGFLGVTGGIGYDIRNKLDRLPNGYVALMLGWRGWDIEAGPLICYRPDKNIRDVALNVMTNINIAIYGPFGINAGCGSSISLVESRPQLQFEWNIGITVRLHQAR